MLTEKDLSDFELLLDAGPDDAYKEREAIGKLIAEARRLWTERKESNVGTA